MGIELHNIVILECAAGPVEDGALQGDLRYVERGRDDVALVCATDRAHGRQGDPVRIARRFEHGLRYFAIEDAGVPVAWFWATVGVPRYFDELRWQFPLRADQAWGRDAFVVPTHRRRRLVRALLQAATGVEGRRYALLSDVDAVNLPSLYLHASLGFRRLCTVRAFACGRLLLRGRPPAMLPAPTAIRPGRRVLWCSDEEQAWHRDHIA